MKQKAVVLHSGGLDSTLCLLMARERGRSLLSLGIDYGQRHRIELEYADMQCKRLGIARRVIRIEWDKPLLGIPTNRTIQEMKSSVSPAFLPGRNAVFLVVACAEAAAIGATEVWVGVNAIDFSGYPDCRPEFIDAFRKMTRLAIPDGPKIRAPLLRLTKPEIARRGYRLGLRRGDVWCCYQPALTSQGIEPCRKCDACILHEHAWSQVVGRLRKDK
jgi:7-cyano-7-deazaguanine synthase